MRKLFLLALILNIKFCFSQEKNLQWSKLGDKFYRDSNYTEAEEYYRKSNGATADFNSQYNLANSLYQQKRFNEARLAYEIAASQKDAVEHKKAMAHYNLGNTQIYNKDYESAIKNYKEALKLEPQDQQSKLNLAKALQLKKIQQQEQKQKENQNEKKDEKKDDKQNQKQDHKQDQKQNENQNEKKDDKQNQKQNDNQKESENKKQNDNQEMSENQKQNDNQKLKKQEAEQILKMIDAKDKKTKEKLQMNKSKKTANVKDW